MLMPSREGSGRVGVAPYDQPVTRIGSFEFAAPLWLHSGADGWHFVSVPLDVSADIAEISVGFRRGFGSVRVAVTVGGTSWRTSIFPDSKTGTYLLPMKKSVRATENLEPGDEVRATLELVDL